MASCVAITGASGFIGSHLRRHFLDQGWQVRALVRQRRPAPAPGLELVPGALEDQESLTRLVEGAELVVHAAGLIKATSRAAFMAANQGGVERLAGALEGKAARLILLSSLAAREPAISPYAASKAAGEAALRECRLDAWTILRPPVVYGPGDPATLGFFRAVAKGIGPILAPADARVSFLHVADLCDAVAAVAAEPGATQGMTYEPDDGALGGYSWDQLIDAAAVACGTAPRRLRVPAALLHAAALAAGGIAAVTGRPAIFGPGKAREIRHPDWASHGASLGAATGWRPDWPLDQGFAQTVAWYRAENWL
ncbi:MAG: NAD-dependent epimerase/dehydratase family protein [Pseudomonadota bacterium]